MAPTDNLASLHDEEERLRTQTLAYIAANEELRDHLHLVREAMNVIWGLTHDYEHKVDDELTIQFLGIRLFNAAACSIKLGLSGYYQNAFQHARDVMETYFLLDYLRSNPEKIAVWKNADNKQLINEFGPGAIRRALDARDGFNSGQRKAIYDLISSHATHVSYRGFRLTTRNMLGELGPFFSEEMLLAWMQELTKLLTHGAIIYGTHFQGIGLPLLLVKDKYLADLNAWRSKYFDSKPESPSKGASEKGS